MSHIHLPDGILPLIWWLGGFLLAIAVATIILKKYSPENIAKKIPYAAALGAVVLVTMSVPLGIIPFHLNLSALAGIILGPGLGFILAFVTNIFLSLFGHGGITVVGLNTLVIGSEAVLAYFAFSFLRGRLPAPIAAAISVAIALAISITLMVAVVGLSGAVDITGAEAFLGHDEHKEGKYGEEKHEEEAHDEEHEEGFYLGPIELHGWTAFGTIVSLGVILESILTALIVSFFLKVRPAILGKQ